jgi:uncharacterized protein (DUF433 family)
MSTNITCNPEILLGKPCISGTRLSVELVLDKLAAGQSFEELLESHPNLTRDGILAALAFARDSIKNEIVYPLAG